MIRGLIFALMLPVSAMALQLTLTYQELFQAADLVVVAEPTDIETRWAVGADGHIERLVFLAPIHWYKGKSRSLDVLLPGGTIDDLGTWVEDVPDLHTDQPYLLFLQSDDRGHWRIFGGHQGAIPVDLGAGTRGAPLHHLEMEMGVKQ